MLSLRKCLAIMFAGAMALSPMTASAASAPEEKNTFNEDAFDLNDDTVLGAIDLKLVHRSVLGTIPFKNSLVDYESDGSSDGGVCAIEEAILKRLILNDASAGLIKEAASIPFLSQSRIQISRFKESKYAGMGSQNASEILPDGIYYSRSEFEEKVVDKVNKEDLNYKGFDLDVNQRYDEVFFEDNCLILFRSTYSLNFECMSLSDGVISCEYFASGSFDSPFRPAVLSAPILYDYCGLAVAVSKDVISRYDFSSIVGKNNRKYSTEDEVNTTLFKVNFLSEMDGRRYYVNNVSGLEQSMTKLSDGILDEKSEAELNELVSTKYNAEFFEDNVLLFFYSGNDWQIEYDDSWGFHPSFNATYDDKNLSLNAALYPDFERSDFGTLGTLCVIELSRNICNGEQDISVSIIDSTIQF